MIASAINEPGKLTKRQQPFFPTDEQLPTNASKGGRGNPTPAVKVKVEEASDDGANEDSEDDEDDDEDGGQDVPLANQIYKKALKILKRKLYFEKNFPIDAEKEDLSYNCWTTAVASMDQIEGGPASANRMFHNYGYSGVVRGFTSTSVP